MSYESRTPSQLLISRILRTPTIVKMWGCATINVGELFIQPDDKQLKSVYRVRNRVAAVPNSSTTDYCCARTFCDIALRKPLFILGLRVAEGWRKPRNPLNGRCLERVVQSLATSQPSCRMYV